MTNFDELDPGIAATVLKLRAAGFETTDSGDGISKFKLGIADETTIPFPHIAVQSSRFGIIDDADRLHVFLKAHGLHDGAQIEATYDPADQSAILLVTWTERETP